MGQKMRLIYNFIDGQCQSARYALTPPRYASSLLAGHDAHSIGVLVWQQLVKVSCPLNRRTACLRHFIIPQALPLAPISTPLGFFPCTFSAASPLHYTSQCASPPLPLPSFSPSWVAWRPSQTMHTFLSSKTTTPTMRNCKMLVGGFSLPSYVFCFGNLFRFQRRVPYLVEVEGRWAAWNDGTLPIAGCLPSFLASFFLLGWKINLTALNAR